MKSTLIFAIFALFFICAVAERKYYFQTVSTPDFVEAPNHLQIPAEYFDVTQTVVFSIDYPLFRDPYFDGIYDLSSVQTSEVAHLPIGFAGQAPDYDYAGSASTVTVALATIAAVVLAF